jgi:BMFP domain-containing protein YqiC
MQTRNRLLDDLARVATGALGVAAGMRREAEEMLKARFAAILGSEGFVTREEFDAVKAMAAKARHENMELARRLEALEAAGSAPTRKRRRTPATTSKGPK